MKFVNRTKKSEFKLKVFSINTDKRRHLDYEHQNVSIRHRCTSENDQYLLGGMHNPMNETNLFDGHNHHHNDSLQRLQQPMYNLRRAAANEIVAENSSTSTNTSLKDLLIFSGTNSLSLSSGIELQRCLLQITHCQIVVHNGSYDNDRSCGRWIILKWLH